MKILLTGGGTMGSATPLLAMIDYWRDKNKKNEYLWIGTKNGIEKIAVKKENIKFNAIASGKLRRYFSWQNFIDPIFILIGFFQSFFIIREFKPDAILSAGSFVSVPVIFAGWLLKIPILIHQMDIRPTLSNKITAMFAAKITVGFKKSLKDYPTRKTVWTGNPIRQSIQAKNQKLKVENFFNLRNDIPVVLIVGGGTGAMAINKLILEAANELTKFCQIIHLTGKNRSASLSAPIENYHFFEFLNAEQMAFAYQLVDIVISRCGIGTLSELSFLKKPSVLIPIPNSHQEDNAELFKNAQAAIILDQNKITAKILAENIKKLLLDNRLKKQLSANIYKLTNPDATEKIGELIKKLGLII
ncbi:MAG: undecaprenyldiphospho-muramoylpentapeptide beta-N-acetylglucosaminyltransferase [Patescibacteria group bacterium]|nr:undecaprenyldiphospho-muramoylpentapeptide beta-N-acetylglucosaminyltransferase [Patescibacteria group bacterium]